MHHLISLTETTATTATEAATQAQQAAAAGGDGLNSMLNMLLLAMMLGVGIYCIYTFIRLRKQCELFPNKFLYPGDCKPEECVDVDGFINYILPRMLIFGIAMLLCGGAYGLLVMVWEINHIAINIGSMVLPLAIFGWYIYVQRKAAKLFW